ncbi:MAG: glycosyltransferase [Elusimicrobiaceae bacterium]|nr:glycosyltransferase [Elusimicrobiaceae bacterium]
MLTQRTPILSLIIPTLNEADNIAELVRRVHAALPLIGHEIIVVDDASPDGTGRIVRKLSETDPAVRLLLRETGFGLSSAVIDGFKIARGRFLGVMDADLSHDAAILPELVRGVELGAQLAVGSRRVPGGGADKWPWHRKLYSNAATWAARLWLGTAISDPMSGYFIVRREVFEEIAGSLNPKGYKILLEIATRAGVSAVLEVPFVFRDRRQGYSKLSGRVASQYLEMLWDLRKYAGVSSRLRRAYYSGLYARIKGALAPGSLLDVACARPFDDFPDQAFLIHVNRPDARGTDTGQASGPYPAERAELAELPFESASFDNVIAIDAFAPVNNVAGALAEIRRVLKPGGVFILAEPDRGLGWRFLRPVWTVFSGKTRKDAGSLRHTAALWRELLGAQFAVRAERRHWLAELVFVCVKPV